MFRKLMILAMLSTVLVGCSSERARVSSEANAMSATFVGLMNAGKTTRDQEQAFIKASSRNFFELDRSIRGTDKANITRANAEALVKANVIVAPVDDSKKDGTPPLNLDK